MKQLLTSEILWQILTSHTSSNNIFVAFSGGLDSQVLLHALAQLKITHPELQLTAIHVNHNLSPKAKEWEQLCQTVCTKLNVPLILRQVNAAAKIPDLSPEEIARKLRYQELAALLPQDAILVTAHHADDQAETLLLQLFRGAGPKGLAAMRATMPFAAGLLVRPLLQFQRVVLAAYAKQHNLIWIEDASNFDTRFKRNFLRHEILPKLHHEWPGITAILNRVAEHAAEAADLLAILAQQDLDQVLGNVAQTVSVPKLKQLTESRQKNVLRYWFQRRKLTIPSSAKLTQILQTVIQASTDATPVVTWHGGEVRRFQDNLYVMEPLLPFDNKIIIPWDSKQPLVLPNNLGTLKAELKPDAQLDTNKITVRFRQGGEVIKLRGHTHHLKKLLQEWNVPPWQRECIPLIYYAADLIMVVNYCVADKFNHLTISNCLTIGL